LGGFVAETANAIGLLPPKKDMANLQFSGIDSLLEKQLKRLEASWARTFYHEFFGRIDEEPFAVLYSDEPSRPNTPINVLTGLETLSRALAGAMKRCTITSALMCRYVTPWATAHQIGYQLGEGYQSLGLGKALLSTGELPEARRRCTEALALDVTGSGTQPHITTNGTD